MSEISSEITEQKTRYKNIEQAYQEVVGIEVPLSPETAPLEFILPLSATGDLAPSLVEQDNLIKTNIKRASGQEWSQAVGLLNFAGMLKDDSVFIKREDIGEIGLFETMGETKRWLRPFWGSERKPISYWQIHPPRQKVESNNGSCWKYGPIFSNGDIIQRVSEDRKSFLYILGAPEDIKVIMQTRKAIPGKIPISTTYLGATKIMDDLLEIYTNRDEHPNESGLANYLKNKGYVIYGWDKQNNSDMVVNALQSGEFAGGIKLKQIA